MNYSFENLLLGILGYRLPEVQGDFAFCFVTL